VTTKEIKYEFLSILKKNNLSMDIKKVKIEKLCRSFHDITPTENSCMIAPLIPKTSKLYQKLISSSNLPACSSFLTQNIQHVLLWNMINFYEKETYDKY
jgi:hypothetical protein